MHCFASENQTYTGTWLFGVESWKSLKGQENLLLKNLQVKTRVENVWFLWWRIFFEGKCGIQSTNEMAFKRTVTLRASFRFPAIRFDAPTLLSFSGFTHAHAKCPPVMHTNLTGLLITKLGNFSFWVQQKPVCCLMKPIKDFVPSRLKTKNVSNAAKLFRGKSKNFSRFTYTSLRCLGQT